MLFAMAVPSILVAVMRGDLVLKSRRVTFGVRFLDPPAQGGHKNLGGVALADCNGVRRTLLHDRGSLIAPTPTPTSKESIDG